MKKLFALLVVLGMIFTFSNPQAVSAGNDNWFEDTFPVDIPIPG